MGTLSLKSFKGLSLEKQQELDKLKAIQQKTEQEAKTNEAQEDQNNCRSTTSRAEVLEAMHWFISTYPQLFSKNFDKPLMVGVDKAVFLEQGDQLPRSKSVMRKGISMYVNHPRYLQAMLESDYRYDLKGNISEPLSSEHKQDAKNRIERQHKKQKQK